MHSCHLPGILVKHPDQANNMKHWYTIFTFLLLSSTAGAQTTFLPSGKIEFERKTNTHRLFLSDDEGSWIEDFKKLIPQFKVDYFDLMFTEGKTFYRPGRETDQKANGFFESPAGENVVYKDLQHGTLVSQKRVFESHFLVADSVKQLEWKIESETRNIAGFECRKAVTRICDSVVVVAFYTEEILPSSGPESFGGLPGMILGMAIPRLYTTWFATKVEMLSDADAGKIAAPVKGKKASGKEMIDKVNTGISDWGDKFRNKAIWFVSL